MSTSNLIWIDLEMTGLNPQADRIIEIATIITDNDLRILAEGPSLAIHQDDFSLANMDEWNTRQHTKSGLIERVRASRIDEAAAQRLTLAFLQDHVSRGESPMCGNSICQDRRFLAQWMPALETYFHYRNLDVSTLKELVKRWYPQKIQKFNKTSAHLALDDIKESIAELRYYRSYLFISPN